MSERVEKDEFVRRLKGRTRAFAVAVFELVDQISHSRFSRKRVLETG